MPVKRLHEEGATVKVIYYNPNIQPYTEWERRLGTLKDHLEGSEAGILPTPDYDFKSWLRNVAFREESRCRLCYYQRLFETAQRAKKGRFDAFSTTLLYSKFQKHDLVKEVGEEVSKELDIPFLYRDWRGDWTEGVETSREKGMYRQSYCGCLFSEEERFAPKSPKRKVAG